MAQILGIDTSNYTTSAALLDLETGEVHQEKQLLPVKSARWDCGRAMRCFTIHVSSRNCWNGCARFWRIIRSAASVFPHVPRNVDGSYMPASDRYGNCPCRCCGERCAAV